MLTTFILGLVAALAEILGAMFVIVGKAWPRRAQETLLALSAGFLLALVFFELIPESFELLGPSASIYLLLGFALLHFFEHTVVEHLHFGEETHSEKMVSGIASASTFFGLTIHAFFDGFSISAGMTHDVSIGLLVFIAILLHKFPEGLTIASVMIAANRTRKEAILASAAIGVATVLGVCAVFVLSAVDDKIVGIAFALSGGVATYVGATDLIPEVNRSENRITPIIVLAGMAMFYLCDQLVHLALH